MATYIYDRLSARPDLDAWYRLRLADLRALADAARSNVAKDLADRRARKTPPPRPLQDYAGVYGNARLGGMEWRIVGDGLESRMGVAQGTADVFDAGKHQFRVNLIGDWETVAFVVPPGGGPPRALQYRGETFERVKD